MKNKLLGLNEEQQSVVLSEDNKLLILACAGSGKTTTTVRKVGYLLDKRYSAERIYCISFTRAAARNLKDKLIKVDRLAKEIKTSTFHSFVLDFYQNKFGEVMMISETEREVILNTLIKRFNIKNIKLLINAFKQSVRSSNKDLQYAIDAYLYELNRLKLMDIEILLPLFLKEIEEDEIYLREIQESIDYLFYDEAQDINNLQYKILEKIIPVSSDIGFAMIGDDDQNIYQWNNTSVDYILGFEEKYHAAKAILNKNYRCSNQIICAANNLISNNNHRVIKDMEGFFDSDPVQIIETNTEEEEILRILGVANNFIDTNETLGILCRSNKEVSLLYSMFEKVGINANTSIKKVYNQEILDLLKLIINTSNELLVEKVLGKDSNVKIHSLDSNKSLFESFLDFNNETALKINKLNILLKSNKTAFSMYMEICKIFPHANDFEILKSLEIWTSKLNTGVNNLNNFINYIDSKEGQESLQEGNSRINITTVHSSKGLEFDEVIIYNFNNLNYSTKGDSEETRRLLYVAITRAIKKLSFYYSKSISSNNFTKICDISAFAKELNLTKEENENENGN